MKARENLLLLSEEGSLNLIESQKLTHQIVFNETDVLLGYRLFTILSKYFSKF